METITNLLIATVAVLHFAFFILQTFFFPTLRKGMQHLDAEEIAKKLAANQGLYNGFLGAGLVWGLLMPQTDFSFKAFFLAFVVIAGIFGGLTVRRSILLTQALPAMLALVFLFLTEGGFAAIPMS